MIQVSKKELTEMVNNGKKKEEIAKHYNLTNAATTRILKEANLKIKKTHKPTYTLIEDTTQPVANTTVN